ncbi:type III secretion system translocon subunit SctE [Yersinia ruckeri]|uniref:type III secretion system translocon subunit SctE n=1 Tax=Yersinia ruckeri TaxID=29486 RepID=UPI0022377772|nr:type III secretion system translocon subunit SctE [Yersinia ruckeri]MCW6566896.1 type III secretion system translocon subunit SctE [Yersinia ruckeri]
MAVDISKISSERIRNVQLFAGQGNIVKIQDEATKALLACEDACRELGAEEQQRRHSIENAPQLNRPESRSNMSLLARVKSISAGDAGDIAPESGMSRAATSEGEEHKSASAFSDMLGSMLNLRNMMHDVSVSEMRNRLKLLNIESEQLRTQGDKLVGAFEESNNQANSAKQQVESSQKTYDQAKSNLDGLNSQQASNVKELNNLRDELMAVKAQWAAINDDLAALPSPPVTEADKQQHLTLTQQQKQLSERQNLWAGQVSSLEQKISRLDSRIIDGNNLLAQSENKLKAAVDIATSKLQDASFKQNQVEKFIQTVSSRAASALDTPRYEDAMSQLTLLAAQLKELISKLTVDGLSRQQAVLEKINETARKNAENKAEEMEEAQRKAEEASKAASCASKILSYVLIAVSVIATVASLGTASALTVGIAAIGIAMAVADVVLEETGNSSLMQMLATEISTGITNMLISFGVPKEKAEEIGKIAGMVLAAIAFLAVSLASMSSFVKNAASTVAKIVGNSVVKMSAKVLPKATQAVGNMASRVGEKVNSGMSKVNKAMDMGEVAQRKIELGTKVVGAVSGAANVVVPGSLNLVAADHNLDMKKALAALTLNVEFIEAINDLIKRIIEAASKTTEMATDNLKSMMAGMKQSQQQKQAIIRTAFA